MEENNGLHIQTQSNRAVFVDKYDDETVWLSIQLLGGGANTTLTFKEARQIIDALTGIIEDAKETNES